MQKHIGNVCEEDLSPMGIHKLVRGELRSCVCVVRVQGTIRVEDKNVLWRLSAKPMS
jgi:hypothetical protein